MGITSGCVTASLRGPGRQKSPEGASLNLRSLVTGLPQAHTRPPPFSSMNSTPAYSGPHMPARDAPPCADGSGGAVLGRRPRKVSSGWCGQTIAVVVRLDGLSWFGCSGRVIRVILVVGGLLPVFAWKRTSSGRSPCLKPVCHGRPSQRAVRTRKSPRSCAAGCPLK